MAGVDVSNKQNGKLAIGLDALCIRCEQLYTHLLQNTLPGRMFEKYLQRTQDPHVTESRKNNLTSSLGSF